MAHDGSTDGTSAGSRPRGDGAMIDGDSGGAAAGDARGDTGTPAAARRGNAGPPRTMDEVGRARVTELRRRVRDRGYDDRAIATEVARRMLERGDV